MPPLKQEPVDEFIKSDLPIINANIDSVSKSTFTYLKKYALKIIGSMIILEALAMWGHPEDKTLYFAPFLIPIVAYFIISNRVQKEFMQQFAQANGYTFSDVGVYGNGYLFRLGYSNSATDQVSGQYNGYPIKLYLYSYTVGSGRSSHTYTHTVFSLEFNTTMPDIILTTKKHWLNESLATDDTRIVKLEGDFDKYFTLHVPKGYEVEALEVFTPDIMSKLIDKAQSLNLEISRNFLYIYSDGFVQTKEKLYALYELARYMTDELGPVLAAMKPSLEATEVVKEQASHA